MTSGLVKVAMDVCRLSALGCFHCLFYLGCLNMVSLWFSIHLWHLMFVRMLLACSKNSINVLLPHGHFGKKFSV